MTETAQVAERAGAARIREVIALYNRRLYRVAWSILRDEAAAEDAVQETYLQVFRRGETFRGEAELGTWLTRIVINQALMQRRKRRESMDLDTVTPSADIILHPALVSVEDPEKLAARSELRRLVEAAVSELPDDFRMVFVLRDVEELSTEEAAGALNIPQETVRSRLHRARARLRESLDGEVATVLSESFPFAGARCAALADRVLALLTRLADQG